MSSTVHRCSSVAGPASPEAARLIADRKADPDGLLAGMITGRDLDALTLTPLRYAVAGLVPEGLTILAGAPKLGKSWAALDMGLAVATGGRALGAVEVERGDVLYLALEDGHRRLQDRWSPEQRDRLALLLRGTT